MLTLVRVCGALLAVTLGLCGVAQAGQLSVSPILLDLTAPAAASTLTLHADSPDTIVQVRVLAWTEVDGKEQLLPTKDVVASPPAVKMAADTDYVVRIVRVSKRPVAAEESYRVLIDQLPNLTQEPGQSVSVLIRQSIPVFFSSPQAKVPSVSWSLVKRDGKTILRAVNAGDRRLRLASLKLRDSKGTLGFGDGLNGYVLGRSTFEWVLPAAGAHFGKSGPVSLTAQSDRGPVSAKVSSNGAQ